MAECRTRDQDPEWVNADQQALSCQAVSRATTDSVTCCERNKHSAKNTLCKYA